jgi:hypothetical protein
MGKTRMSEEVEEEKENTEHCTSACQYANKIECVCGCGGKNHGIKAIMKMDAFFFAEEEKREEETEKPQQLLEVNGLVVDEGISLQEIKQRILEEDDRDFENVYDYEIFEARNIINKVKEELESELGGLTTVEWID